MSIERINDNNFNKHFHDNIFKRIMESIFSISGFIFIFSSIIFCEVIIFKCCNLDKFTKNEISKRAINETINGNILIEFTN